jgi:BirA family biotin operon repressor/biotin-[acetyl-CoA-carboxylase] ligase
VSTPLSEWLQAVREGVAAAAPRAGALAQHVLVLEATRSTNDDVARAAIEGAPEGYTVIAAEQTAGRGRRGASWHSPALHGLYLSTLLRPDRWASMRGDAASPAASLVTLMAGVAVAEAVGDACGAHVELKWPNDVMVRERPSPIGLRPSKEGLAVPAGPIDRPAWRKLAGILAEGASDGGLLRTVVLGIGINVHRSPAPDEVARRMIALEDLPEPVGVRVGVDAIVAALLVRLRVGCDRLARGEFAGVLDDWRRLAPSVDGTAVRWHHQQVMYTGRSRGIDETGALRVRTAEGRDMTVHGGEVEWLLDEA